MNQPQTDPELKLDDQADWPEDTEAAHQVGITNGEAQSTPVDSSTLYAAVCAVMADIKRLEKADDNTFARYAFTSIDDFKDLVRPLMAKHGLSLHVDQTSMQFREVETGEGAKKKASLIAEYGFAVTIRHSSGESDTPEHLYVPIPFTGPQTSGAARSYVVKEWIKGRFLASSGDIEEEADMRDQDSWNTLRLSKAEAREVHAEMEKGLRNAALTENSETVGEWWQENKDAIATLPKDWHIKLRTDYENTWKELRAKEKLDKMSESDLDDIASKQ